LAHVPISERILQDLHTGIRREVLALITTDETVLNSTAQSDPRTIKWHGTLLGKICSGNAFVTGTDFGLEASKEGDGVWFEWATEEGTPLRWNGAPFLQLDEELKVLLLFRLPGLEADLDEDEKFLTGEYHRFAAEIEPVQEIQVPVKIILPWIPVAPPEVVESIKPQSEAPALPAAAPAAEPPPQARIEATVVIPAPREDFSQLSPIELRDKAESAYRNRNYPLATRLLDELASRDSDHLYNHVTKLRHGEVLWKSSERGSANDRERVDGLVRAISLLTDATDHRDVRYAARAKYQLSKAYWHLWKYTEQNEDLAQAVSKAQDAANLVFEPQYISWYERIRQEDSHKP